jgi:hypothetical protein
MNHKKTTAIVSNFVSKGHADVLYGLIQDLDLSVLGIEYRAPCPYSINHEAIKHTPQSWTTKR